MIFTHLCVLVKTGVDRKYNKNNYKKKDKKEISVMNFNLSLQCCRLVIVEDAHRSRWATGTLELLVQYITQIKAVRKKKYLKRYILMDEN